MGCWIVYGGNVVMVFVVVVCFDGCGVFIGWLFVFVDDVVGVEL